MTRPDVADSGVWVAADRYDGLGTAELCARTGASAPDEQERDAFQQRLWMEPLSDERPVGVDGDGALLVRTGDGSLERRVMPV